jgi:hypothetical protein
MAIFTRTSHLLVALGVAAVAAAGCVSYGGRGAVRTHGLAYEALKSGYDNSTAGREARSAPVADTLADAV